MDYSRFDTIADSDDEVPAKTHARPAAKPWTAPPFMRLAPGAEVSLHGLVARPDLNGAEGVVMGLDEKTGRWQVELDEDLGSKSFKEENLEVLWSMPSF